MVEAMICVLECRARYVNEAGKDSVCLWRECSGKGRERRENNED